MNKWLSLFVIFAVTMSTYAYEICKYCEKKIADGKEICNACQEESDKNTLAVAGAWMSGIAQTQKKQQMVDDAAAKLGDLLSEKQVSNVQKVKVANELLKRVNAPEFYETIAANAPLSVVKYFWPDRNNKKVYLISKKVHEKNNAGPSIGDAVQFLRASMGTAKLDAPKKAKTAFALGRSKKDDSIRFVDPEEFSFSIINAAVKNPDIKVLQYFLSQTEGLSWEARMEFLGSLLRERQEALIEKSSLSEKLAAAEKKLKYADDQFDQKKYSKQVAALKNELAAIPDKIVLDDAKAKLMFAATTRFEIYYLWEKQRHYATRNSYGAESAQLDNAFSDVAAFVAKFCTPAVSAWIKAHSNRMSAVYYSKDGVVFGRKTPCSLPNGNMTAGVVINELPCSVYVQDTTGGTVEWGIGIPHINKPGFVSTNNKGELAWKAGIPDTTRLGFISGAKENEWVLAPGFKKDGNAAKWVPGVAHPTIKGLITGAAVCSWIPDSKHMWVDPKDPADLSVRKDCKVWENILRESQAKNRSRYRGR